MKQMIDIRDEVEIAKEIWEEYFSDESARQMGVVLAVLTANLLDGFDSKDVDAYWSMCQLFLAQQKEQGKGQ